MVYINISYIYITSTRKLASIGSQGAHFSLAADLVFSAAPVWLPTPCHCQVPAHLPGSAPQRARGSPGFGSVPSPPSSWTLPLCLPRPHLPSDPRETAWPEMALPPASCGAMARTVSSCTGLSFFSEGVMMCLSHCSGGDRGSEQVHEPR